ncbi:hypothetical protein K1719_037694 [Acacia pycnantha]|nr:hypothetical protein K1719_037694 [Acacia pycnantha]
MDMLNDHLEGVLGGLASCLCKNNEVDDKDCMRRTVGGLVVAFLRAHLDLQSQDLDAIVANPSLAPAKLDPAIISTQHSSPSARVFTLRSPLSSPSGSCLAGGEPPLAPHPRQKCRLDCVELRAASFSSEQRHKAATFLLL